MGIERKVWAGVPVLVVGVLVGLVACDGDQPEAWVFLGPDPKDLAGVWTGEAVIVGTPNGGTVVVDAEGFRFPVSLELRANQEFVLRTFGYPVSGSAEDRTCVGIYRVTSRRMEFFPNTACRALPVSSYRIGRFAPNGLTLRSEPWEPRFGTQVEIRVERSIRTRHR